MTSTKSQEKIGENMSSPNEKIAEEAVRKIVHKHRRRNLHESCNPELIMLNEQTLDIIATVASLLDQKDTEKKEAVERVVSAVEETRCNNVYHKEDAAKLRANGLCNFCYGFIAAAKAAANKMREGKQL